MSQKSSKSISSNEFQWLGNSGEAGAFTNGTTDTNKQPAKETESWFSKSDPGADPAFSTSNPYVASNGKQLSYEESHKEWTGPVVPPTPPQPQILVPNSFIVAKQQAQANLPRSNSLPAHPQGMHALNLAHQRQSMPNLLHPSRPANHSRMILSQPQLPPLIAHQHPQGPALMPQRRNNPQPPIPRRMSNPHSPNVMQNRFVQPQRFQVAPQPVQQMRTRILHPQPAVVIPRNGVQMQQFLLQHHQSVQNAKVLHPRNGNVNFTPPPQSLIQYNPKIMMNQTHQMATQLKAAFYPHNLAPQQQQQQQHAHHRNLVNGHRNAQRKNHHGRNKHVNHQGNARNNESKNKFTSVLKPVKNDKHIHDNAKSKTSNSQTKNLLEYDHRVAYHMPSHNKASNGPPLKRDPSSAPRNEHTVQKAMPVSSLKKQEGRRSKLPQSWLELFQNVLLVKHITKYLSLHEFLNVYGVLSKSINKLLSEIGWVESILITFGDKRIILNNDIHLSFYDSEELVFFLKALSSISIRHLKLQVEGNSDQIPFEFFKTYFGGSHELETIAVNATTTEESSSRKWQQFLIDLDFEHLAIENKPFLLDDWFVKKLAIKTLTISSPEYPLTLNLVNNLPSTVKAISICRPSFSISKLLEKVNVNRIYLRNPSRKPPLESTELIALFTKVFIIELDFSLLGDILHIKLPKSHLKVEKLIFVSDGTPPTLVQKAKRMLSSTIDVSIKWTIID